MFRRRDENFYGRLAKWVVIWAAIVFLSLQLLGAGIFFLPFFFAFGFGFRRGPSPARYAAFIVAGLTLALIGVNNSGESDNSMLLIGLGLALSIGSFMLFSSRVKRYERSRGGGLFGGPGSGSPYDMQNRPRLPGGVLLRSFGNGWR